MLHQFINSQTLSFDKFVICFKLKKLFVNQTFTKFELRSSLPYLFWSGQQACSTAFKPVYNSSCCDYCCVVVFVVAVPALVVLVVIDSVGGKV